MSLSFKKNSVKALSLVEVMVALGILGITVSAGSQIFTNMMYGDRRVKAQSTRDEIVNRMQNMASTPAIVRLSAAVGGMLSVGNARLDACLREDSVNCPAIGVAQRSGFSICTPRGGGACIPISGPGSRRTTLSPVFYSFDGERSMAGGVRFPLASTSQFWAACPGGGSACDVAETIYITFRVYQDSSFDVDQQTSSFPIAAQYNSNPAQFAIAIKVSDITEVEASTLSCPHPLMVMKGVDANGVRDCQCPENFESVDSNTDGIVDSCRAASTDCSFNSSADGVQVSGDDFVVKGIFRDGSVDCMKRNMPIGLYNHNRVGWTCTPKGPCDADEGPGANNCDCSIKTISGGINRDVESWIGSANLGNCRVTSSGKKGGDEVVCDRSRVMCCRIVELP